MEKRKRRKAEKRISGKEGKAEKQHSVYTLNCPAARAFHQLVFRSRKECMSTDGIYRRFWAAFFSLLELQRTSPGYNERCMAWCNSDGKILLRWSTMNESLRHNEWMNEWMQFSGNTLNDLTTVGKSQSAKRRRYENPFNRCIFKRNTNISAQPFTIEFNEACNWEGNMVHISLPMRNLPSPRGESAAP